MMLNSLFYRGFSVSLLALSLSACNNDDSKNTTAPVPFNAVEGTAQEMQVSLKTGGTTCRQVVQGYLDRIAAYDKQGPTLNSIITINPNALAEADVLDQYYKTTGKFKGSMHCVTVLAKDNIDTDDMPTSAGSNASVNNRPLKNAYIIQKIKNAGGIILGKTNLDEFAFSYQGNGTHPKGGQVKNAYDLTKGPGGSSSGTGASITASFAMVGIGTDTGGSVRVPSSVEGLYGLRPSLRLVSQSGIIPLAPFQDTAGPLCRAVQDCALLMDQMVGYDIDSSANQRSAIDINAATVANASAYQTMTNQPASYLNGLDAKALKGAHIGVVRALFSTADTDEARLVNATVNQAIKQLQAAGAIVEDVTISDLDTILTRYSSMSRFEFKVSLDKYLQSWPNTQDNHLTSYASILASGLARSNFGAYNTDLTDPTVMTAYTLNTQERPNYVRTRLLSALNNTDLDGKTLGSAYDVLLYPTIQGLPSTLGGSPVAGNNNRLSPFSGFPAMNLPAGFVSPTTNAPKLPVGMEILGREFDEARLFKIAYAWQQTTTKRLAPPTTPALVQSIKTAD